MLEMTGVKAYLIDVLLAAKMAEVEQEGTPQDAKGTNDIVKEIQSRGHTAAIPKIGRGHSTLYTPHNIAAIQRRLKKSVRR